MKELPAPPVGAGEGTAWVAEHLDGLFSGPPAASERFRGGQRAADSALSAFDVSGYARRRNEVWPLERRGASGLSPWVRHGLIPLPRLWRHVAAGPARDVRRFRDELLWQEYARHLYARLGRRTAQGLRNEPPPGRDAADDAWPRDLACIHLVVDELERTGWIPNQTRMWLASHWTVREGAPWQAGEDRLFRRLLDGSRAANRLGWQWTVGAGTGKPYGFSRWQVEKRAPGLCERCPLNGRCPIEGWPASPGIPSVEPPPALARDEDLERTAGPETPEQRGEPTSVWLTAESLGDADPALTAHPELPAIFVFDEPLLTSLQLSFARLVFLSETLGELATRRPLRILRGAPARALAGERVAVTFAPVPGFRRIRSQLGPAVLHPWPWLVRPHRGTLRSFSAWRRALPAEPEP